MRIVFMLTSLGVGGAERQALALAERMRERGHGVAVFTLRPQLAEEWPTSLPVFRLGMRKDPFSLVAATVRAHRYLCDLAPHLIHSHSFHANIFARCMSCLLPRTVVVSTIHNIDEGGRLRMLAYRLTDGLCAQTTAVSEAVAERFVTLKSVPRSRCAVVANGIDAAAFVPDPARRAKTREALAAGASFIWLAAGRIAPAKDYPTLLRAFARVRATHADAHLWIAGEGTASAIAALRRQASELGIEVCMQCLGLRRDLDAVLDAADGFVLSSAWEGMPLALAEAMAMEKPVVATDVGGVRELVGETGMLVPPRDPEALARAMDATMRAAEPDRRAQGRAARARIERHFSLDARVEQWAALYEDATRRPRTGRPPSPALRGR
jgi:glycosyltransferase involved in cell wall biosynthesis